jgi:hypothetical protein
LKILLILVSLAIDLASSRLLLPKISKIETSEPVEET